ncbi:hypothetical protein NDU88_003832 [Pleurodeles waltl]|uniref:Uncharacterized protein n=1 Tax=Pleurodeles waltl TaxID=8319 RepID=A0AAV7KY52_PLEWA|nr:hypothetical protein NDU88_003832 [Pleurodeles waltl]
MQRGRVIQGGGASELPRGCQSHRTPGCCCRSRCLSRGGVSELAAAGVMPQRPRRLKPGAGAGGQPRGPWRTEADCSKPTPAPLRERSCMRESLSLGGSISERSEPFTTPGGPAGCTFAKTRTFPDHYL